MNKLIYLIISSNIFKHLLLFYFLLFGVSSLGFSQNRKDTIQAGVYLKSLYDFNSSTFSYDVDLWMWFKYTNDSLNPLKTIEIANAKKYDFSNQSIEKRDSKFWATQNCKATINQNWSLKNYPFDHQKLEVVIEESEMDSRKLFLAASQNRFEYNDQIDIKGWKIDSTQIKNGVSHYKTDFGDPSLNGESDYSKVFYTIYLSRNSTSLFFKLFTGCYVAFLVAFLVFFIKPIYVDPRFGLSIGGLFAAVGNKYVADSNMPESISFTLVDSIHDITFVFILLTIVCSIISLKIYDSIHSNKHALFDKIAAAILMAAYIITNVIMILSAARH